MSRPLPKPAPEREPDASRPEAPPEPAVRCRRCHKAVTRGEHEPFFTRAQLCFWCAYVDPQG